MQWVGALVCSVYFGGGSVQKGGGGLCCKFADSDRRLPKSRALIPSGNLLPSRHHPLNVQIAISDDPSHRNRRPDAAQGGRGAAPYSTAGQAPRKPLTPGAHWAVVPTAVSDFAVRRTHHPSVHPAPARAAVMQREPKAGGGWGSDAEIANGKETPASGAFGPEKWPGWCGNAFSPGPMGNRQRPPGNRRSATQTVGLASDLWRGVVGVWGGQQPGLGCRPGWRVRGGVCCGAEGTRGQCGGVRRGLGGSGARRLCTVVHRVRNALLVLHNYLCGGQCVVVRRVVGGWGRWKVDRD